MRWRMGVSTIRARPALVETTEHEMAKSRRDIEKAYPLNQFVAKLRRLADSLESGKPFSIQIDGERISVPAHAVYNVEHERGTEGEEIEFQIKWAPQKT